jgi:integrase
MFMLAAGVLSRVIMEVLGHSGISLTMNTYAHVLPALRQEAAAGRIYLNDALIEG